MTKGLEIVQRKKPHYYYYYHHHHHHHHHLNMCLCVSYNVFGRGS